MSESNNPLKSQNSLKVCFFAEKFMETNVKSFFCFRTSIKSFQNKSIS